MAASEDIIQNNPSKSEGEHLRRCSAYQLKTYDFMILIVILYPFDSDLNLNELTQSFCFFLYNNIKSTRKKTINTTD